MKKFVLLTLIIMSLGQSFVYAQPQSTTSPYNTFFQTHGFVFFFASTCPYCHQFSPVLSRLATAVNAQVLPLSFDNQPLPEFKEFLPATSEWTTAAFKNEAIHYPALFIANPKTQALYSVSIGSLNENELLQRLDALIPKIKAYEDTRSGA
jgi:type-F conjugative transfer system pilin assembly thiol-disulfide isomerase TrbB